MKHGALFGGVNGFGLAAKWAGIETAWISEIDEYCTEVNKKKFPEAKHYGDIKEIGKGRKWEPEHTGIVSGGFPCQTFSLAGKGEMDLSLWKEMLRVIQDVSPRWVIAENVFGIVSRKQGMALESVCVDLENEGFTVFPPLILPACSVGAPHKRDRVWIVANSTGSMSQGCNIRPGQIQPWGSSWGKDWQEVASEFYRVDDGLSHRVDRITALGNAIVPQVAYEIFKAIKEVDFNFSIKTNQQK
jgi:DNA (cytosine-5)-methyltransferase 1